MFKHRSERFEKDAVLYEKRGNREKAEWAKEQSKENLKKAKEHRGEKGW